MTRDAGRKAGRYPTQLGAQIAGFIDDFAKQWVENHENASKEAANRRGAALMWSMIAQHAQSRLGQLAGTCDTDNPGASESLLEPCMAIINALGIAERNLASNVNMRLVTDHLVSLLYGALGGAGESIPVQHASIV